MKALEANASATICCNTQQKGPRFPRRPSRIAASCDYLQILRLITADLRLSKISAGGESLEVP